MMATHTQQIQQALSYHTLRALSALCDCSQNRFYGTSLEHLFGPSFPEIIQCGALRPDAPLRAIGEDGDDTECIHSLFRSAQGTIVCLTEDGLFTPSDEARRQYLFDAVWFMNWLRKVMGLSGVVHATTADVYMIGTLSTGHQQHAIYYSRRPTLARAKQLAAALDQRPLPMPATVLYGPTSDPPPEIRITNARYLPVLETICNPQQYVDREHFKQCILAGFLPAIATQGDFTWLEGSATFLFPDQRTIHFRPGHSTSVIKFLIEQWHTGEPWINEQHLLQDLIRCNTSRVRDLLRRVDNWQEVVWISWGACRLRVPLPTETERECPPSERGRSA